MRLTGFRISVTVVFPSKKWWRKRMEGRKKGKKKGREGGKVYSRKSLE